MRMAPDPLPFRSLSSDAPNSKNRSPFRRLPLSSTTTLGDWLLRAFPSLNASTWDSDRSLSWRWTSAVAIWKPAIVLCVYLEPRCIHNFGNFPCHSIKDTWRCNDQIDQAKDNSGHGKFQLFSVWRMCLQLITITFKYGNTAKVIMHVEPVCLSQKNQPTQRRSFLLVDVLHDYHQKNQIGTGTVENRISNNWNLKISSQNLKIWKWEKRFHKVRWLIALQFRHVSM